MYIYLYIFCVFVVDWQREKVNISKLIGLLRDLYFLKNYLLRTYIRVCFQLLDFVGEHMWHKAILLGHPMRFEFTRVGVPKYVLYLVHTHTQTHTHTHTHIYIYIYIYNVLEWVSILQYFVIVTHDFSSSGYFGWGREDNEPHLTVRCWVRLILSVCYLPDLLLWFRVFIRNLRFWASLVLPELWCSRNPCEISWTICAIIFCSTNVFGGFHRVMARFEA